LLQVMRLGEYIEIQQVDAYNGFEIGLALAAADLFEQCCCR